MEPGPCTSKPARSRALSVTAIPEIWSQEQRQTTARRAHGARRAGPPERAETYGQMSFSLVGGMGTFVGTSGARQTIRIWKT